MRINALTPRETECAELIADGLHDKEIALRMHISIQTVKQFVHQAVVKTDVRNRVQLGTNWNYELFQIGMRELGILRS